MKSVIVSEKGKYRELNEDSAAIFSHPDGSVLCVLCDGMGGHDNGEIASAIVPECFKNEFFKIKPADMSSRKVTKWFESVVKLAQQEMTKVSTNENSVKKMGTTVTVALVCGYNTYLFSVGDSRLYTYRKRKIQQVTIDQNVKNLLMKKGASYAQAYSHPQANALYSSVGPDKFFLLDFYWERGWRRNLMLTTDGIHDYISEKRMHEILMEKNLGLKERANKIISEAERNGSRDNLTILLLERDYYGK